MLTLSVSVFGFTYSNVKDMIFTNIHNIVPRFVLALLLLCAGTPAGAYDFGTYPAHSQLSSGKWVKIKVKESGMYAITKSDIAKWGLSSLANVRVYGYGAMQQPESLSPNMIYDLPQVPVLRIGEKVVFYGRGPIAIYNNGTMLLQRQHPYAVDGCYFVTDAPDTEDVTVKKNQMESVLNATVEREFVETTFHESELYNMGETGRQLVGEDFRYKSEQTFNVTIPGYVHGGDIKACSVFAAGAQGGGSSVLRYKYNGTPLPTTQSDYIAEVSDKDIHARYSKSVKTFALDNADNFTFTINFSYSGTLNLANLDYLTVNYPRLTALDKGYLSFRHNVQSLSASYALAGAAATTRLWDVTNPVSPVELALMPNGNDVAFNALSTGLREYVAFNEDTKFLTPTFMSAVPCQDIHGQSTPDMIVITPAEYMAQAQRLARLHEAVDSMRVLVVTDTQVYNEFSSGTPEAMAYRKVCKMFYDRGTDADGHRLAYLILFGGGSYDNRRLTKKVQSDPSPMLLTYQSEESASENTSYTTDDVFAMLEDDAPATLSRGRYSIAVGRIPARSVAEAKSAVDKLADYVQKPDFGVWKTSALNVADDDNNAVHMEQQERAIDTYRHNGGNDYTYNRVYIDAYEMSGEGGKRVSEVGRKKMFRAIDEGVLWFLYVGHGNPNSWTAEGLFTYKDMTNMYNRHLPFLYAATCDFARFDASSARSGAEVMFFNSQGGVIALLSSTRLAYIPNNGNLNAAIAKYVFACDGKGQHLRIGEAIRRGKNELPGDDNKLRYVLLGDPALRLSFPEYKLKLEKIDGKAVDDNNMPVLQARQTVSFEGRVVSPTGKDVSDFNGTLISTLYDAEQSVVTHGYGEQGEEFVFQDRSNKLALVKDSISNGKFSFTLTIPSELNAADEFDNYSPSRLSLYAFSDDNTKREAIGSNESFYIYGYDDAVPVDTIGPEIRLLAINNDNFKDGENVNDSPLVVAEIMDGSGINLSSSGIGHEMTLKLDDKTTYSDVSSHFEATYTTEGNGGRIAYPLSGLTAGEHRLKLKVWDVFNNSSEKTITFNVMPGLRPELYDVYAVNSTASIEAIFYVKHNRPDAVVTVDLRVYDLMGRQVWSTIQTGRSDLYTSFPITWNLCDYGGNRVPRGIYVYKASISTEGTKAATKAKKLSVTGY